MSYLRSRIDKARLMQALLPARWEEYSYLEGKIDAWQEIETLANELASKSGKREIPKVSAETYI